MPKTKEKYPIAAKLRQNDAERRTLVNFMEWLTEERDQPYELAYFEPGHKYLTPANTKSHDLIFEFMGIDPKELEEERRQMLEEMQNVQTKTT